MTCVCRTWRGCAGVLCGTGTCGRPGRRGTRPPQPAGAAARRAEAPRRSARAGARRAPGRDVPRLPGRAASSRAPGSAGFVSAAAAEPRPPPPAQIFQTRTGRKVPYQDKSPPCARRARPAAAPLARQPGPRWRWEAPGAPRAAFIALVASLNGLTLRAPQGCWRQAGWSVLPAAARPRRLPGGSAGSTGREGQQLPPAPVNLSLYLGLLLARGCSGRQRCTETADSKANASVLPRGRRSSGGSRGRLGPGCRGRSPAHLPCQYPSGIGTESVRCGPGMIPMGCSQCLRWWAGEGGVRVCGSHREFHLALGKSQRMERAQGPALA